MGHFATGVAVVTGRGGTGRPFGLTVNAVTSVSLEPVLVLVCLDRTAESHARVLSGGVFAVNVLGADGEWLARRFSEAERGDRFDGVHFRVESTGSPILGDALAWLDCRLWRCYEGGDHSIVVGEVEACDAAPGPPLLFYRGRYRGHGP